MIHEIDANLLEHPLDGFLHSCNCFHIMGGGIARFIKEKYPELYKADLMHGRRGDVSRLGKFSTVKCHDDKQGYNMYGQYNFGMEKRHTNYEAVYTGLLGIAQHAIQANIIRLGLPKNMGCRLGGGSWSIVRSIIDVVFDSNCGIDLYICNYEG
jgi:O-acetyl-ADP-ribose deacetylase (regulator of RNase III)